MKKLLAAMIAGSFAFAGASFAADKKPTEAECKKAMEEKKELKGCEKPAAKK